LNVNTIDSEVSHNHKVKIAFKNDIIKGVIALCILVIVALYASTLLQHSSSHQYLLIAAAVIGGYMALNIGANDVANNMGPTVGSNVLSMTGAIVIAAIFEAAGALIAGGDVVSTIKNSIIDPSIIESTDTFIWLMMAALLAAALWLKYCNCPGCACVDNAFHRRRRIGGGYRSWRC
jgi:PiT family inorganic phosphate transporter